LNVTSNTGGTGPIYTNIDTRITDGSIDYVNGTINTYYDPLIASSIIVTSTLQKIITFDSPTILECQAINNETANTIVTNTSNTTFNIIKLTTSSI